MKFNWGYFAAARRIILLEKSNPTPNEGFKAANKSPWPQPISSTCNP
jgi:hypothetical protein